MRRLVVLFVAVLLCTIAQAQQNADELAVTDITSAINGNYALCGDNADLPEWLDKQIELYLPMDAVMHLSAAEHAELLSNLQAAHHAPKWEGKTLNNVPLISADTIKKIFADTTRGWAYFKKEGYSITLYHISRPVFIRNGQMCLVYYDQSANYGKDLWGNDEDSYSCELWLCVKTSEGWVKKQRIFKMIT